MHLDIFHKKSDNGKEVLSMKKPIVITAVILLLLIAAAGGWLYFNANYIIYENTVLPRTVTELDLSGRPLSAPEKLTALADLQQLDLQNTGLTTEQYNALCSAMPNCSIQWSVPFQNTHYPNDTRHLTITTLTDSDIRQLAYFPGLQSIDATGCTDYAMLTQLQAAYPGIAISYQLHVGSQQLPQDTTRLTLSGGTAEELSQAMAYLPNLTYVDATGCHDYAALEALKQQYPGCTIAYTVALGERQLQTDVASLDIADSELSLLEPLLPYLPNLTTITITDSVSSPAAIVALRQAYPDLIIDWTVPLCGLEFNSLDTVLDLSNIPMESTQAVEDALQFFPNLQRVIMCQCGISNEEMEALWQRNPDIRFVWTITINRYITVRTDITYFMPYHFGCTVTDKELVLLKYCQDLVCIDLGHMDITDVSFLAYMPHMKYLLLCDTEVSDISAVAGMEELVYVELFLTNVTDYSPLLTCKNLKDLNICYSLPSSMEDLAQMTQLENLWVKGNMTEASKQLLLTSLGNTNIVFSDGDISSTGSGWRELQNYYDMRDFLGMFYMKG